MNEAQSTTTPLSLTLELLPGSEAALLRVMATLHRRCCRVTRAEYTAAASGDRLELSLDAPRAHAQCVPAWLDGLIDVTRVDAISERR